MRAMTIPPLCLGIDPKLFPGHCVVEVWEAPPGVTIIESHAGWAWKTITRLHGEHDKQAAALQISERYQTNLESCTHGFAAVVCV